MHWCLLLSVLLLAPTVLCLDISVTFGNFAFEEGYPSFFNLLFNQIEGLAAAVYNDPWGDQFDLLENFYGPEYNGVYAYYFNTASFAPWPAPHTTLFAPNDYYSYLGFNYNGFYPITYNWNFNRFIPGEYLGIYFDLPATELFAVFEVRRNYYLEYILSEQYYYQGTINNVFEWPYETYPSEADDYDVLELIFPFHVTARTVDGYFYYDWLIPRAADPYLFDVNTNGGSVNGFDRIIFMTASDPRGIDLLKVYSMIPENNRQEIYFGYNWEYFELPYEYNWLYLETLIARIASPSSTRTITATTTPSPNFKRHPTFSPTISPTETHTITPSASRTPIFPSKSNTPTRTPNRSLSNTPSPSSSPAPPVSPPPSASALGQSATASRAPSASVSRSPVTPSGTPTVTNTATGTRTSFLTASNTQQPGRNVPSASIAPSSSPAANLFAQPGSSTAVLVQFNVLCAGYCSGTSAEFLQLQIAEALTLDTDLVRIVAIHEFFEGDSEITLLICSNSGVDTVLNSIQAGTFTQEYFVSISVESVDWTVKCNVDLYNYEYIPSASSASALLPLFVLFFLQLWMLV